MRPDINSQKVLSYTQAIAKIIEFNVPKQDRDINIPKNPEELFTLVIGMLGDVSEEIITNSGINEIQEKNIRFCASFFDAYKNTERLHSLDDYSLLIGATAYYLCNLPGSASVLIKKINASHLDLHVSKLDLFLYWLLKGDYSFNPGVIGSLFANLLSEISTSFCNFFKSSVDESKILLACKKLQSFVYSRHNPREFFITDLIYAICIKKINNSCWKNLPIFTNLSEDIWKSVITKKTFITELWPAQLLLGQNGVFAGQSAVIQMPTSAGKTKSTEIIIRSSFLAERSNIAVIVAPFKALCHEIKNDFIKAFFKEVNISIDAINDVFEDSELTLFADLSKKHIIILTPEKLYYLLTHQQTFAENIGLIIFDEGHQFDTGERGVTYELLLTELKRFLPKNCQKILISAVIHNAQQISEWLSGDTKVVQGTNTLPTERSIGIVNFDYGIGQINFINKLNYNKSDYFVPKVIQVIEIPKLRRERKQRYFPDREDSNSIALFLALKMSIKENVAIFCGKKNSVNKILRLAVDYFKFFPNNPCPKNDNFEIQKLSYLISQNLGCDNNFYTAAQKGVFAHYSDIPYGIKMAVEHAMHESLISFIVCTSTLAQGVNLPIKYLFISSTHQESDTIKVRDFQNLIGRVGRAGKLTEGCIIFTNPNIYPKGSYRWNGVINLLNPENSEDCSSSLLSIFEPFRQGKTALKFKTVKIIIDLYFDESKSVDSIAKTFNSKYPEFTVSDLEKQIKLKFSYIEKIENFLMMMSEYISSENILEIAKSTLAYQMADNNQKNELINLFVFISEKIKEKIDDKEKLPVYAKTLRGLNQTFELRDKLTDKKNLLIQASSSTDLLDSLWDIFIDGNIQNSYFNFYSDKEKLKCATKKWIEGVSFFELFNILQGEKINSRDYIKIEGCVNIFENGIVYSGSVLINAITEIVNLVDDQDYTSTINLLTLFQKQLKYGLPTIESILIYEWGFCDRVIAQEIAKIIPSTDDKYLMKMNILEKKDEILEILKQYPSYYEIVLERIVE